MKHIDIVKDYTYLGTRISSPGNFTLSLEHLRQKALHALFSLRRHTGFSKLKPSLANKIFDTMISPILTYNSEVWGAFVKSDFKSWDNSRIEKTYLHFCKPYLQVHNKSSNVACRSEPGRFPLIIDINNKILNYLNYLQEKDENSIVKQSLKISVDLYHSGQNSFYSSLKKMTDYYDFPGFNCNLPETHKGLKRVTRVQCSWIFILTIFGNLSDGYPFSTKWLLRDHHADVLRQEFCISRLKIHR